jgi:hypothetical protein
LLAALHALFGCGPATPAPEPGGRLVAYIVPLEQVPSQETCEALCAAARAPNEEVEWCQLLDNKSNVESRLLTRVVYDHEAWLCEYR